MKVLLGLKVPLSFLRMQESGNLDSETSSEGQHSSEGQKHWILKQVQDDRIAPVMSNGVRHLLFYKADSSRCSEGQKHWILKQVQDDRYIRNDRNTGSGNKFRMTDTFGMTETIRMTVAFYKEREIDRE